MEEAATEAGMPAAHVGDELSLLTLQLAVVKDAFFKHVMTLLPQTDPTPSQSQSQSQTPTPTPTPEPSGSVPLHVLEAASEQVLAALSLFLRAGGVVRQYDFAPWAASRVEDSLALRDDERAQLLVLVQTLARAALESMCGQRTVSSQQLASLLNLIADVPCLINHNNHNNHDNHDNHGNHDEEEERMTSCLAPMIRLINYLRRCERYGRELPDAMTPQERYREACLVAKADSSESAPAHVPPACLDDYYHLLLASEHLFTPPRVLVCGVSQLRGSTLASHVLASLADAVASLISLLASAVSRFALCCNPQTLAPLDFAAELADELRTEMGHAVRRDMMMDSLHVGALTERLAGCFQHVTRKMTPGVGDAVVHVHTWLADVVRKPDPGHDQPADTEERRYCVRSALGGLTTLARGESYTRAWQQHLSALDWNRPLRMLESCQLRQPAQKCHFLTTKRGTRMIASLSMLGMNQQSIVSIFAHASQTDLSVYPVC